MIDHERTLQLRDALARLKAVQEERERGELLYRVYIYEYRTGENLRRTNKVFSGYNQVAINRESMAYLEKLGQLLDNENGGGYVGARAKDGTLYTILQRLEALEEEDKCLGKLGEKLDVQISLL
jgi:hypothetical protein